MTNQADYSKLKNPNLKTDIHKEAERLRLLDIRYGSVVVPYRGNDVWMGLRGKRIIGQAAAHEYAKKLSELMDRSVRSSL